MLYIDIGGHIGNYTDGFVRCPGVTDVYCFEPNPYNLKILHDRFGTNNKVHIMPYAVGMEDGAIKLFRYKEDESGNPSDTGRSSIFHTNKNVSSDKFYEVKMMRLSNFLRENNIEYVDCIKIDVEGAEYDILEDLIDTGMLDRIRQIILSEHRFLFSDDFSKYAESVMRRFHKEYKGIIQLEG